MGVVLTDAEIAELVSEVKDMSQPPPLVLKPKLGYKRQDTEVDGDDGHKFKLILRLSQTNAFDFSAILGVFLQGTTRLFLLRRYNGKSHEHSNPLEGEDPFYDFHIHEATERYQGAGYKEELYAKPTNRYRDIATAVQCLYLDCGFRFKGATQSHLQVTGGPK